MKMSQCKNLNCSQTGLIFLMQIIILVIINTYVLSFLSSRVKCDLDIFTELHSGRDLIHFVLML